MDLIRSKNFLYCTVLTIGITTQLTAAPKLRLDKTAIGPVSVATGTNGPLQVVNALNAGDSPLNLQAASSVPWLTATVQPRQPCGTLGANCNPINIALNTSGLPAGTQTGSILVTDPNALDAPQTITVTVAVGGNVPNSLTFFLPTSGAEVTQSFTTARNVSTTVTQPPQVSLSVAAPGGGSFASVFSYTVTAKANAGAAPGTYNGTILVAGSPIGAENKSVPVTFNVTDQPIASPFAISTFRIAQGAAKQTQSIRLSNLGTGAVTVASATVATTSGGAWATTALVNGFAGVTVDPTGLAPGSYQGTVTIVSNAANGTITVPIALEIIASGTPVVQAGGVVNNATFEPGLLLAQGELPAIFGEQFTTGEPLLASTLPLPTTLGGATVFINDQPVPIYYVSAGQINFQVPFDAATGEGTLRVDRGGQRGNTVTIAIARSSPRLLIAVNQAVQVVSTPFVCNSAGQCIGGASTPVQTGTVVTIYSLGLGPTNPPVASGAAAPLSPLAVVPGVNKVFFGAGGLFNDPVSQTPQFVGLSPNFVGLYQINVEIPANAPRGASVPVFLQGDAGTSNTLRFNIQ